MNEPHIDSRLRPLYDTYNNVIKPLIAEIEARGEVLPLPLFNEIRAFNSHVASCFNDNVTDADVSKELSKAERHILRIELDCFKCLDFLLSQRIEKFERQTRNVDLTVIDNGTFYSQYVQKQKRAINLIREAKKLESELNNERQAIERYEQSYNQYTDLELLIEDKVAEVKWARIKFWRNNILKVILWLLSAILSGIVSSYFDFF